ncbi:MAG TPA: HdeD family acid-resistance protein [Streptosporangiaceae bacterium]|nr:HdeD family acid-resistance protein [Streptosporangiaceae bacterium]
MSDPRTGSSGQPGTGQAGTGQAGTGQPAVPRQTGPGDTGQYAAGTSERPRQRQPGPATVEERFAMGRMAQMGKRAWMLLMLAAVATVAVGIILLAWPKVTVTIAAVLLGAGLVIGGLWRLFEGFLSKDLSGGTRAAYVVIGLIAGLAGLYCLRHHDVTIFLLAFIVGAFWIIHGFADLGVAAGSGKVPGRGMRVVAGLFSIAAGAIVLFWPGISLTVLVAVFGAWLCFYGVLLAGVAVRMRRTLKDIAAAPA